MKKINILMKKFISEAKAWISKNRTISVVIGIMLALIFSLTLGGEKTQPNSQHQNQPLTQQEATTKNTVPAEFVISQYYKMAGLTEYIIIPTANQAMEKMRKICNQTEQQNVNYVWGFKSQRIADLMDADPNTISDWQDKEIENGFILKFTRNPNANINQCEIGPNGWHGDGSEIIKY